MTKRITAALTAAALLTAAPVHAQRPGTSTLADALFLEGKTLMDKGKIADACPKFAESQRLDPAIGTLLNLALCHEKQGKTATAWTEFNEAAAQAARQDKQRDREQAAREHATSLEALLRRLVIEVKTPAEGIKITVDGELLGPGAWGSPLPMDPGAHDLEASAPGRKSWSKKLTLAAGPGTEKVEVPNLEIDASAPPTKPVVADDTSGSSTKKTVGLIVGGVGVVGLGIGVFYLARAGSLDSDSKNEANLGNAERSKYFHDSAKDAQTLGLVIGGLGIAALGAGAFLFFTSGGSTKPTAASRVTVAPHVGLGSGGVQVLGVF